MLTITQHEDYGCGAACVAMLCGIEITAALDAFKPTDWKREGVGKLKLERAFEKFGFVMHEAEEIGLGRKVLVDIRENLLLWGPILNRHLQVAWNPTTRHADLKFKIPTSPSVKKIADGYELSIGAYDHWAVWDGKAQVLRDPYGYQAMFVPAYFHRITAR